MATAAVRFLLLHESTWRGHCVVQVDRSFDNLRSFTLGKLVAIFATGSTVTVSNSVAVNTTAPLGNGGYIYSSDGIVEVTNTTVAGASSGRLGGIP